MSELLESVREKQRRRTERTMLVVMIGMTALFAVVIGRVVQLQFAPSEALAEHVSEHRRWQHDEAVRGDLLDRRGRVIAASKGAHRLIIDPTQVEAPYGALVAALSDALDMDATEVGRRLIGRVEANRMRKLEGRSPSRYLRMGPVLSERQEGRLRRMAESFRGMHFEACQERETLFDCGMESLVGKVGAEERGLLGAELTFEEALRPDRGRLRYVHDGTGSPLWTVYGGHEQGKAGDDIRLSIDAAIQQIAWEELGVGLEQADAAGGRIIIADPTTGEILAMADRIRDDADVAPFDAAEYLTWLKAGGSGLHRRYDTIPHDPFRRDEPARARNRCVEDLYEPGSTFKPFMWSVVTERGLAAPEETIPTHKGRWRAPNGRLIEDVSPMDELSWSDVLLYSSNIGMVQVTARLSDEQMRSDVLRFGFGRPTGIGLPGESPGIVTPPSRWSDHTQTSVAMGYEVGVTPLQMIRAFSVFARNGPFAGSMPALRLEAAPSDVLVTETRTRVLPDWVAYQAREAMVGVAEAMNERASRRYPDEPALRHTFFGKSGTAKIVRPDGRGYLKRQYNSSFIAGGPVQEPRLVVLVIIDDPGPERIRSRMHYGSAVAGPVVRRVMRRVLEYLGVPPDRKSELDGAGMASAE
ncbi:MAG: penicillin-binding protein 2 [Phycisphaerales bacterium]